MDFYKKENSPKFPFQQEFQEWGELFLFSVPNFEF